MQVQLRAYALAAHEAGLAPRPPEHLQVTFAYLGNGLTEVTEEVDAAWLTAARAQLARIVDGVLGARWDPAPSSACRSCDFLRFCPAGRDWIDANRLA